MRNVTTTTISLPKAMARRARQLSREENSTMSELFREAFREYENKQVRSGLRRLSPKKVHWEQMQKDLREISRAGKKINLTEFLSRDRHSH